MDSPLEGSGFEPPVPLAKRAGLSGGTGVRECRRGERAISKARSILGETEGSNPISSTGESRANLTSSGRDRVRLEQRSAGAHRGKGAAQIDRQHKVEEIIVERPQRYAGRMVSGQRNSSEAG